MLCLKVYTVFAIHAVYFQPRFSPPHVKRKRKLEEMAKAYGLSFTVAEFYTKLLTAQSETV